MAGRLRDQILAGAYADGKPFPPQPELAKHFEVSAPSIREALRILEAEGLISVQRGRDGGAVVHRPRREKIAYMLGMVLQSEAVEVHDVMTALRRFDPLCIAACAARRDRHEAVLPALHANLRASKAALQDAQEFQRLAGEFHRECVQRCGNQTTIILMSALETVVGSQLGRLAEEVDFFATFRELDTRKVSLREHEELAELIADGDEAGAERLARVHYSEVHWETPQASGRRIVDSNLL